MTNIYFAGSIRGGRADAVLYQEIIRYLQTKGHVLTEHIGDNNLTDSGEKEMTDLEIYQRDLDWLKTSDYLIAEVTTPSLGVGFEIATALELNKPVICFFRKNTGNKLSAMIAGCKSLRVEYYQVIEDIIKVLDSCFAVSRPE